jgi:predicted Zn-dependent peptidase
MQIFVTGGMDENKVKEKIEWYFREINVNSNHDDFRNDTTKPQVKSLAEEIDSTQSHMVMYLAIDNAKTTKEYFIQEMAKDIFGNGFGSRLMEIREKYGYAYTIYCDHLFIEPESLLYVYIGLNKENIEKTKELMLEKLNTLISQGITIDELNTAKNCLLTQVKSNKISTSAMNDMRINFLNEQLDFDWDIQKLIDEVNTITVQDIENYYHTLNIENVGFITLNQTKD